MNERVSILIVDDEDGIRDLLCEALKDVGAEVYVAANESDALGMVQDKNPMVILVDICIPGTNGYRLVQKFKNMGTNAAIISMTAYETEEADSMCREKQEDYHIKKPFDIFEVKSLVREALDSQVC